jgi:hypothetical protein
MKIELRRITYNARLSEETPAYAADVYVDGKKRGTTQNDGHGGMDMIHPHSLQQEIDAYAKTLPLLPSPYGAPFEQSAETIFGDLLDTWLVARTLKRALKTKTLFVRGGKLYEMKLPHQPTGEVTILNALPFDEAVQVYIQHTRAA